MNQIGCDIKSNTPRKEVHQRLMPSDISLLTQYSISGWLHPLPVREEHHVKVTHVVLTGIAKCESGLQNTKMMRFGFTIESELNLLIDLIWIGLTLSDRC